MSYTHCPVSTSPPPMDFTVLHEIMRGHIRRGNHFAVLGILALTVVHEDPAFWQTCTYHDGIASAVIATCVGNDGVKTNPPQESRCLTEEIAPNLNQEFLTENELYLMLRRVCGKDPLLCRVIHQLEMDPVRENNTSSGRSKELDAAVSAPSEAMRMNLDEVLAVLHERFCSLDERRSQSQGTTIPPATIGPQALKRARESNGSEENLGDIATESAAVATPKSRYLEPVDDVDGAGCSDALEVLAHIHALPGTTCALNSFDAVAGLWTTANEKGLNPTILDSRVWNPKELLGMILPLLGCVQSSDGISLPLKRTKQYCRGWRVLQRGLEGSKVYFMPTVACGIVTGQQRSCMITGGELCGNALFFNREAIGAKTALRHVGVKAKWNRKYLFVYIC
ncbi:putative ttaggg binding factor [Trypanosoma cruzi]|uniref:Putative ttaggg binding factor n=1 Tax=Trypanosoma cruzi TaxID=5693 RepID=A0A2V2W4W6_TRYCR|nr:putative ttaggg binding factor [Trypanosoma cruzi]